MIYHNCEDNVPILMVQYVGIHAQKYLLMVDRLVEKANHATFLHALKQTDAYLHNLFRLSDKYTNLSLIYLTTNVDSDLLHEDLSLLKNN